MDRPNAKRAENWADILIEAEEERVAIEIPQAKVESLRELISPDLENALDAIERSLAN